MAWRFLTPRALLSLLATATVLAAFSIASLRYIGEGSYTPLIRGISPAAASRDTSLLDRYGIPWRLDDAGQTLAVATARRTEAQQLLGPLAAAPSGATSGLQQQLDGLLASTVGPGKALVYVNQTFNRNQSASASLAYGGGTPLARASDSASWTGGSSASASTAWGRNETVTRSVAAGGGVQRLTLSLVVDPSVPAGTASALARAVAAAAGLQRSRRDSLTVSRLPIRH